MSALGLTTYVGIALAAAVEGEVVFVAAAALAASGHLAPAGVLAAGAVGAAVGDQAHFLAARGAVGLWRARRPGGVPRPRLLDWVRRHQALAAAAVRFVPGFRVALTAVCAATSMPTRQFCLVNAITSVIWAAAVMGLVSLAGSDLLPPALEGSWPLALVGLGVAVAVVGAGFRRLHGPAREVAP